jgi:Bacterial Ig-like domain (group 2)
MPSTQRKLRLISAFAALATLALAISCRGFFTNPVLTSVSVGPSGVTLNVNQTFQMTASGTYDDGTQKALSSGVVWNSDTPDTVSVGQTSGVVTGLQTGSATISASAGACSACTGSAVVTVVLTGVTLITVSPSSQTATAGGQTVYYTATAQPGSIDITSTATWTIQDQTGTDQSANFSIGFVTGFGEGFLPLSTAALGKYTVVVTYPGTAQVGTATLTVD